MAHDYNYFVCVDCYMVYHYGAAESDLSPDWDRNRYEYKMASVNDVTDNTDSDTGEGITEFSKAPCDTCGSHLAGSRYRMAVWDEASRIYNAV